MQTINTNDVELLQAESPISLHLYIDDELTEHGITKAVYTGSVASGEEFSLGNVCASSVEMTLDATDLLVIGKTAKVTWSVGETEYRLIEGFIDSAVQTGYETTIKVYDYLYTKGQLQIAVPTAWRTSCNMSMILSTVASTMDIMVESNTASWANDKPIPTGNLADKYTCAELLSLIGVLLGGNFVINRAGKLQLIRYHDVSFTEDPYEDDADANSEPFSITGIKVVRTDTVNTTDSDGNTNSEQVDRIFTVGSQDAPLVINSPIATQSLANYLYDVIKDLSFKGGSATFGNCLYLEAGDVVTVDSLYGTYKHAINEISIDIDGGCKTSLTVAGKVSDSNTEAPTGVANGGSISQSLKAVKQDYGSFKTLVADNLKAQTATITDLKTKMLTTDNLESNAGYIANLVADNFEVGSINGNAIHNSHILAKALSDEAVETILGNKVYYRATAPETANEGDLWYQTVKSDDDKTPTVMYQYRDGQWTPEPLDSNGEPLYASIKIVYPKEYKKIIDRLAIL